MPKFAVVTGASSGIGAEFARQLSARGYNLMLVARRADRLEALSDQLTTVCEIMAADLSKKSECMRLAKALEDRRVDLFINNAGFGDCGPFLQTELDKDLDMLSVNIRAVHILTKKIGQKLYKQGFGALLNVGSCAGLMPAGPYMATYYATKAYVVSLTSALAQELKEAHSPVYAGCLCPGPVDTEFNAVANVEFALRGITPEYCVRCALDGIARRKTVIVPSPLVAAGMTLGELGLMVNGERWLPASRTCDLTVIPCKNYTHQTLYKLPIPPSPNLPNMKSIYLYPSTCYFEATPVSLGRGTDLPFQVYGHPNMTGYSYSFTPRSVPGAKNPPQLGKLCHGVNLSNMSDEEIWKRGIDLSYVIDAYRNLNMDDHFFRSFFELLIGTDYVRKMIKEGKSAEEIKARWKDDVEKFKVQRKPYLLYEE